MARAKRTPPPIEVNEDAQAAEIIAKCKAFRAQWEGRFTAEELKQRLMAMTPEKRVQLLKTQAAVAEMLRLAEARLDFSKFVKIINPDDLPGRHFDELTKAFHRIAAGEAVRLIINIAPRRGKSERASYLFPAWYIGKFPKKKILTITNIKSLASDFGSKVRNLMDTEEYQKIFKNVRLSKDAQAKDKWRTNHKGEYYAAGAGSTIYGRGADLCVVGETMVHTELGEISAKEAVDRKAKWILSLDEKTGRPSFKRIVAAGSRMVSSTVVVKTSTSSMECTSDHPVFVHGRGYVEADSIAAGDSLCRLKLNWFARAVVWISRALRNGLVGTQAHTARTSAI